PTRTAQLPPPTAASGTSTSRPESCAAPRTGRRPGVTYPRLAMEQFAARRSWLALAEQHDVHRAQDDVDDKNDHGNGGANTHVEVGKCRFEQTQRDDVGRIGR